MLHCFRIQFDENRGGSIVMKSIYLILYALTFFHMSQTALGAEIRLSRPNVNGTGCRANTVVTGLSSDRSAVTIIFSNFISEVGNGRLLDNKSCFIILPVQVPIGYSVSFVNVDFRGYVDLDERVSADFENRYIIAGHLPFTEKNTYSGPISEDIFHRSTLGQEVWSPCSASMHLNIRTTLKTRAMGRNSGAIGLDSIDASGQANMRFNFKLRPCTIGR